ncbi:origin recognition complex subunit 3 N-terminus-domain-containing protein [Usnea florida]
MSEFEGCYLFTLDEAENVSQRPRKRRKTEPAKVPADHSTGSLFAPLLNGLEGIHSTRVRSELLDLVWRPKENLLKRIQSDASIETVKEVTSFIVSSDPTETNGKLRTGLIATGPDKSMTVSLFDSIARNANLQCRTALVVLSSEQSPNLKTAIKCINQRATSRNPDPEDDAPIDENKNGRRLNYDLAILSDYVQSNAVDKVLLSFQDSDAFEGKVLTDLIDVLSSWRKRIPFVLLFGIATSAELFQEKLSRSAIKCLDGTAFDVQQAGIEEIFKAFHTEQPTLWVGPTLSRMILQRQKDYIQGHSSFVNSLKYAYMTHFFANPLSVFLDTTKELESIQTEHYEAVRNLPSFRRYAQTLIKRKEYEMLRTLLDENDTLGNLVVQELQIVKQALLAILGATNVLFKIQSKLTIKPQMLWSEMYIRALSADLAGSAAFEEIMGCVKRLPSDTMEDLLDSLSGMSVPQELIDIRAELDQLSNHLNQPGVPSRSGYDVRHETFRTTVVAQKVSLSRNTSTLSTKDSDYTKIVDRIYKVLCDYFESALIDPQGLFLNEILIFDSKSPHREVFTPKPRFATERAFTSPHDYLGCDCCGGSEGGLSPTQPATAILYQLYLESGAIINTADLWSAFWTIVGEDGVEDEEAEQRRVLALFSRALAELKYLGMVKNSLKKPDHLAKLL